MTAKRPSALRDQMARSMARPAPAEPPKTPSIDAVSSPPAPASDLSKFTVLLDGEEAATFDQLALDVRRLLGRRVVKGDLVRALVALAGDDPTLRDQVVAELRARPSRRRNGTPS